MINVVATKAGFCGNYRNVGDTFLIKSAKNFSREWMRPKSKEDVIKLQKQLKEVDVVEEVVEPEDEDFGLSDAEAKPEAVDELDNMDKEALIDYGKVNCVGLTLTRTMKDDTIRERIRDYNP